MSADDTVLELRAGPKRKRRVIRLPSEAWMIAHDVTLERVEERLHRAFRTMDAMVDSDARFRRGFKTAWPDYPPEYWESWSQYGSEDLQQSQVAQAYSFKPTAHDVSDALGEFKTRPFDWLKVLERDEVRLIRLRAMGFGASFLAARWGMSKQLVSKRYRDALVRAWNAAIEQAKAANETDVATHERSRGGARSGVNLRHRSG